MSSNKSPLIKGHWHLIAIVVSFVIATSYLSLKFGGIDINFEAASTLGSDTSEVKYEINQHKIHCSDARDSQQCIKGVEKNKNEVALWLGNSQLHAVNQLKPNQLNAPAIAFRKLEKEQIYLMTFSQPNANAQEHLLTYIYLNNQKSINYLVLPVVFDDFREDGIRSELLKFTENKETSDKLVNSAIGRKIIKEQNSESNNNNSDNAALAGTIQDQVEKYLNDWFDQNIPLWNARQVARGTILTELYLLRNTIFGITPNTKRKIIKGRYQSNMNALIEILNFANTNSTPVLIYIAPLRNDVEIPYDKNEYAKFKSDIELLAKQYRVEFSDLENLVPPNYWGSKDSTTLDEKQEIDFMHFQSEGHNLLANEVVKQLIKLKRVINDF